MAKQFTWDDYDKMLRKPRFTKIEEQKIRTDIRMHVAQMKAMAHFTGAPSVMTQSDKHSRTITAIEIMRKTS